jgi:hypothetical protein
MVADRLPDDEKCTITIRTPGGPQEGHSKFHL